ncbi:hypothetical protein BDF19DRAFT_150568 [Syncephalis fuscata]|nr:hypothetical protein BDF19DRAFT_150568 [Syncephalis fuscata]
MRKPNKKTRKEDGEVIGALYPWTASEQLYFTQLGDTAIAELNKAYQIESQWLTDFPTNIVSNNHNHNCNDTNSALINSTTKRESINQVKRPRTPSIVQDTINQEPLHLSKNHSSLTMAYEEPYAKRNRSYTESEEPQVPRTVDAIMSSPPVVSTINAPHKVSDGGHLAVSSRINKDAALMNSETQAISTNTASTKLTHISSPIYAPLLTENHPFIDNTIMSTPTATSISLSKDRARMSFASTLRQLSGSKWSDLSPIVATSSPSVATAVINAINADTVAVETNTVEANTLTANTVAIMKARTSTESNSIPQSSISNEVEKLEEWMSPVVVRHKSLFTHFKSLSTMMTSNRKYKEEKEQKPSSPEEVVVVEEKEEEEVKNKKKKKKKRRRQW